MYYKLYFRSINSDGSYVGPYKHKTYQEAKNSIINAEYLIIKHDEETDTDEVIEHGKVEGKNRKNYERDR